MLLEYLQRGVMAGVVAGLVFGLLTALVANPLVAFADELGHGQQALEGETAGTADGQHADVAAAAQHDAAGQAHETGGDHHGAAGEHHASGAEHSESAVSATVTHGVSVLAGVLWGILLGGVVFGAAYYLLEPAIPGSGATKSYVLAGAGFLTVSGVPWLVLPPRPPGVTQTLPTEMRLLLYGGAMLAGALTCLLAGWAYGTVRPRRGRLVATAVAILAFAPLGVLAALSPANPVEHALPTALATGLTGLIVFGQALLWLVLGATHGRLHSGSTGGDSTSLGHSSQDPNAIAD